MIKRLTISAAFLVFATATSAPAIAQSQEQSTIGTAQQSLGGPLRRGNMCWTVMDSRGFGFWRDCAGGGNAAYGSARRGVPLVPDVTDPYAQARENDATLGGGGSL